MRSAWSRLCRAFTLLSLAAGVGACVPPQNPYALNAPGSAPPMPTPAGKRMAILVPLTGGSADVGTSLLRGAQLALDQKAGGPPLDSKDTGGTAVGAARAAREAIQSGAGIILGPLTAGETGAVAPIAREAGVPVLAFTSDRAMAQPGVWTMGITPAQQVRTLLAALRAENKTRLAAVLPSNAFGDALADGLAEATAALGAPPAQIVRFDNNLGSLETALKQVAGPDPTAPPPVDALLLGTSADLTVQAIPLLGRDGLGPDRIQILGTTLWGREAARLSGLSGAWYAAPDPQVRAAFEGRYRSRYGGPPRDFASIAFDSAGAARATATADGFNPNLLTRPDGFAGADGVFVLLPDGRVRRGLALFEIGPTGARVRQPGPRSLTAPGV